MTKKAINKTATGMPGLDSITRGGLPEGGCTLLLGSSGCGKTVLTLQTLLHAARTRGEPGIFVTFAERWEGIDATAESLKMEFGELNEKKLFFLKTSLPSESSVRGSVDLPALLAGLGARAKTMGARWIVFDAIDIALSQLDNPIEEMREFHRLRDWLSEMNLTGILNVTLDDTDKYTSSRNNNLQFLADCVLRLEHRLHEQVSLHELRVVKYRDSEFYENPAYYVIGPQGFEAATVNSAGYSAKAGIDRISSGIDGLDRMLTGGYYRGSAVLITGLPGTAKTILSSAFAESACLRGEKVVYATFDELPGEVVRHMSSVGISLEPHLSSGCLQFIGTTADIGSGEEHLSRIETLIQHSRPNCLVIDSVTALFQTEGNVQAANVARRIVGLAKQSGITLLITSLQETGAIELEARQMHISTIADTWIHLTCREDAGERKRFLSVMKSRGSAHSNQLRELILKSDGATLADPCSTLPPAAFGSPRMGTFNMGQREHVHAICEREAKRWQAHLALDDTEARIRVLQHDIEKCRVDIEILNSAARFVDQILKHENRLRH